MLILPGFPRTFPAALLAGWLAVTAPSCADELEGTLFLQGNMFKVQVQRGDQMPVLNAKITVVDNDGNKFAEASTGSVGHCWILLPPPGAYDVLVDAGPGDDNKLIMTLFAPKRKPAEAPLPDAEKPPCCRPPVRPDRTPELQESFRITWLPMGIGFLGGMAMVVWLSRGASPLNPTKINEP